MRVVVAVVAVAAVGIGGLLWVGRTRDAGQFVGTGEELDAAVTALPPAPLERRRDAASVWTGRELLVWGGGTPWGQYADGAAYDPDSGEWRTLAPSPLSPRDGHVAVWTGSEMLVWGGGPQFDDALEEPVAPFPDGAAYDPAADTWRALPPSPPGAAMRDAWAVWAAGRMVVVSATGSGEAATLFHPETGTWTSADIPGIPAALATDGTLVAILTMALPSGQLELVWLDPASGTFAPPTYTGLGPQLGRLSLAWAGDRFVATAGHSDGPGRVLTYRPGAHQPEDDLAVRADDLVAPRLETSTLQDDGILAWTGRRLLTVTKDAAAAYDPGARTVSPLPVRGLADGGLRCAYGSTDAARVWTGDAILVWGGMGCTSEGRAPVAYGYQVTLGD